MNGHLNVHASVWRTPTVKDAELLSKHFRVIQGGRAVRANNEVNLSPPRVQKARAVKRTGGIANCAELAEGGCAVGTDNPASHIHARTLYRWVGQVRSAAWCSGAKSWIVEYPKPGSHGLTWNQPGCVDGCKYKIPVSDEHRPAGWNHCATCGSHERPKTGCCSVIVTRHARTACS